MAAKKFFRNLLLEMEKYANLIGLIESFEPNPAGENSSFIFTVYVKFVLLYHCFAM